jgi:hypothetical protein
MTVEPTFTHDCEGCTFLGTVANVQSVLVTDAILDALTKHVDGKLSIADLHSNLGVKPAETFDLYFCMSGTPGHEWPTVIARYGNDGPDYKSGLFAADTDPELSLAKKLAEKLGLVKASE